MRLHKETQQTCELFLRGESDLVAHFTMVQSDVYLRQTNPASQNTDI